MQINGLKKEAIDFFLYSYFGIVTQDFDSEIRADSREAIIKKCAYRAYLDMCRTLKFKKETDAHSEDRIVMIASICGKMAEILEADNCSMDEKIKALYGFLEGENEEIIKLKESLRLEDMKRKDGKDDNFPAGLHYGQIQKWIQMTLKYMWLLGLIDDDNKASIEIPIDSIIMQAMSDELGIDFPRYNNKTGRYSEASSIPWSKLNQSEYENINEDIDEKIKDSSGVKSSKIEWESNAWIWYAEKKKQKERTSNNVRRENELT